MPDEEGDQFRIRRFRPMYLSKNEATSPAVWLEAPPCIHTQDFMAPPPDLAPKYEDSICGEYDPPETGCKSWRAFISGVVIWGAIPPLS